MIQLADLPTRRNEAWKYSDLRAAARDVEGWDVTPEWHKFLLTSDVPESRKTTVDGADIVAELVRATTDSGTLVYKVGAGEKRTLVFDFEAVAGVGGHALEINVEETAQLSLVERWRGEGGALGAAQVNVRVASNASVTRTVVQSASKGAVLTSMARVSLDENASFKQVTLAEGAKLARMETHVSVEGTGASVTLNAIYMSGADQHADLTSLITHSAADAETRQLIKGVAAIGGRGVFQGKIIVERAAQKTDARQYHHGMLLEAGAEIFAKPELLIHADDVQCAHGNTAGGLDETAKFYLRSRGVPEKQARAMLIEAFLVGAIPDGLPESIDGELRERIGKWLQVNA